MTTFSNRVPIGDMAPASDAGARSRPVFRRVLVPVEDANQAEHVVELAQRAGASEARVLHLNLHESIRGRRFPVETESAATRVVEATVLELSVAGIPASGVVCDALVDKAAEAIIAEATEWGADLIVLGSSRRSELATRLFGSVTLRLLHHAPCPVLVDSAPGSDHPRGLSEAGYAGSRS